MAPDETILQRLKKETQGHHEHAETLVDILEPSVSLEDYRRYLASFLGFMEPVERRLAASPLSGAPGLNLPDRRKSGLLRADLEELGETLAQIDALPRAARLPEVSTLEAALGCCYVLEGSTLGGQFILRQLRPRLLSKSAAVPFRYLECYGRRTGEMWKAYGRIVTEHARAPDAADAIVAGAQETFTRLTEWLAKCAG